jgi:hypothetical protein
MAILIMVAVTATAMDTALATATRRLMPIAILLMDMAPRSTRIPTRTAATPLAPMPMPDPICRTGTGQRGTSIEPTTSGIDAGIDRRQPPTAGASRALSASRRARPVVWA